LQTRDGINPSPARYETRSFRFGDSTNQPFDQSTNQRFALRYPSWSRAMIHLQILAEPSGIYPSVAKAGG
jgi:hypothetical protein